MRTEVGWVLGFAVGLLVGYVGLALCVSGDDKIVGGVVLVLGLWLMRSAPVVHDRLHEERGEERHAVWGRQDRRKPPWWRAT